MRNAQVVLDTTAYHAGETLKGKLIVTTNKEFTCNKIVVILEGDLIYKLIRYRHGIPYVHKKNKSILNVERVLKEKTVIPAGTTEYEFELAIPIDAYPSFAVKLGGVQYTVKGIVDIPRAFDIDATTSFVILPRYSSIEPHPRSVSIPLKNGAELFVELENDLISPNTSIGVKTRLMGDPNIRSVKYEIIQEQHTKFGPLSKDSRENVLGQQEIPKEDLAIGQWLTFKFLMPKDEIVSIDTNELRVMYKVKITVDIPYWSDKTAEIPLRVGKIGMVSADDMQ